MFLIEDMNFFNENKLSSENRKSLPSKEFGLPSQRKFPIHDAEHVMQAIRMFNNVEPNNEKELAHNILNKMSEYGIDRSSVGKGNRLRNYITNDNYSEDEMFDTMFLR